MLRFILYTMSFVFLTNLCKGTFRRYLIFIVDTIFVFNVLMFLLIYIYITDLVCYTNFHWFFNHECQHIFGKHIFQSPKNAKNMDDKNTNNYTSLNQYHNTYFYQIKCRFYPQNGCMNKKKLQQIIPHTYQIDSANSFHGCTIIP